MFIRSFSRSVESCHGSTMLCQNAPDFADSYQCKKVSAFFSVVSLTSSEINVVHFRFFSIIFFLYCNLIWNTWKQTRIALCQV